MTALTIVVLGFLAPAVALGVFGPLLIYFVVDYRRRYGKWW